MQVGNVKDLLEIRNQIDETDSEITALYQKRMELAAEVAEYKIQTGKRYLTKCGSGKSWKRYLRLYRAAF